MEKWDDFPANVECANDIVTSSWRIHFELLSFCFGHYNFCEVRTLCISKQQIVDIKSIIALTLEKEKKKGGLGSQQVAKYSTNTIWYNQYKFICLQH